MATLIRDNPFPPPSTLAESVLLAARSSYLKYLPAIYSESDFMGRFLMVFESVLSPIEETLDNLPGFFDPYYAPSDLLPWLASWFNLVLDKSWPLESRRALIKSAVHLYQLRGTKRGLRKFLKVYSGIEPEIIEELGGMTLDGRARLGWNTVLGGGGGQFTFRVRLRTSDPTSINIPQLKSIIDMEKPAYASYTLEILDQNGVTLRGPM